MPAPPPPTYTPVPDANATAAQRALYARFEGVLPRLRRQRHPEGSVGVYIFPGHPDRENCDDNTAPLYWTWFSRISNVPILSGYATDSCAEHGTCTNETRFSGPFYDCPITGVDHSAYTNSDFDRGHMVASHSLARSYGATCETFNMCNIAPQSAQMNQEDWRNLETTEQAFSETEDLLIMQGALLSPDGDSCVCGKGTLGMAPCSEVEALGCNDGGWQIRVPSGFFKLVFQPSQNVSWAFRYTKAQSDVAGQPQPNCKGPCETIDDAFASKPTEVAALEAATQFEWGDTLRSTASTTCKWCTLGQLL